MPAFGGYVPSPERYGGAVPVVKTIIDALNAARGTAYDVTTSSPVWVENMAIARAIADVYNTNTLLGNQFDPRRMSVLLSRWEKICGLAPLPTATDADRRAALTLHVGRTGVQASYQEIVDRLTVALAPVTFTIVHHTPSTSGVITSWPGGWYVQSTGTTPPIVTLTGVSVADYVLVIDIRTGGAVATATFVYSLDNGATWSDVTATAATVVLGSTGLTVAFAAGTYNADNQYFSRPFIAGWMSTVAYIAIVCTKPTWMTEAAYYDKLGFAWPFLDAMLPAWVTFAFVRDGTVVGQFILDDVANLDNERLG